MPNTQQINDTAPPVQSPVGGRNAYAFFSSGAITFGAMMAMLEAEQNAMNGMAALSITTTQSRASAIMLTASSTNSMYVDDAQSLTQQSNEQWASVAASFGSVGANAGGLKMTAGASRFSTKMDDLHDTATSFNGKMGQDHLGYTVGQAPQLTGQAADQSAEDLATHNTFKNRLLSEGGISPEHYADILKSKDPMNYDLRINDNNNAKIGGKPVTLKSIFESAKDPAELAALRSGVGKGKLAAAKALTEKDAQANKWVSIGTSTAQAATAISTSQFKLAESQAMRDKGADSMTQTLSQNNAALAQETAKSQADQSEKFNNLSGQVWQSINQLVQVDTRG